MIPEPHSHNHGRGDDLKADPCEIAANIASIREIPVSELPDVGAREELIRRARAGEDIYSYRPACSPTYVLWVRPAHAWQDGRWEPMEWARCWRAAQSAKDGDA